MEVMILDITQLLDICISDKLIDMVISGQKNKSEDKAVKIRIRPVILKNEIEYQVSEFVGRKVLHSNHSAADVKKKIIDYMTEDFKYVRKDLHFINIQSVFIIIEISILKHICRIRFHCSGFFYYCKVKREYTRLFFGFFTKNIHNK